MKKLSLIMALVILLSAIFSVSAYAADNKDVRVTEIDGATFKYSIIDGKYAKIVDAYGVHFIPSEINGYPVKIIGNSAYWNIEYSMEDELYPEFSDDWNEEWIIPDTVTSIKVDAFRNNPYFKTIRIPTSVKEIGWQAFASCYYLEKISFPDSVSRIEGNTFYDCVHLKDVTFPKGLEYIGKYAFDKCYSLETYDFSSCNWLTLEDKSITNKKAKIIAGPYSPDVKNYATENNIECLFAIGSNSSYAGLCSAGNKLTLYVDREKHTDYSTSTPEIIKLTKNGKLTALKKGTAKFTVTLPSGKIYKGTIKVLDDPVLKKKVTKGKKTTYKKITTVSVKKGKTVSVKIFGKAKSMDNKYTSTSKAQIVSKKTATTIKIKGKSKGTSTVKIKVNGVKTLKLKVKVK